MKSGETEIAAVAQVIRVGRLTINRMTRHTCIEGAAVDLTAGDFELLWFLAQRSGQIVSRDELYRELLKIDYNGLDRCIDIRVSRLRRKLGDCGRRPDFIKSIRSEGYVLVDDGAV